MKYDLTSGCKGNVDCIIEFLETDYGDTFPRLMAGGVSSCGEYRSLIGASGGGVLLSSS